MRPFIGLTCSSDPGGHPRVNPRYVQAVHRAGGLPVPLPWVSSLEQAHLLLDRVHGLLFTGSEDIDPAMWGEERHPKTVLMHPDRMATEIHLARAALERRPPTLAVCGGMQTLNVVAGGTLYQHIPDLDTNPCQHSDPSFTELHAVRAAADSLVGEALGATFGANTEHHQAIRDLGDGLRATAWCSDGLVEAFEGADGPWLVAVQWHPERMLTEPGQARLFEHLTAAAGSAVAV